jgi:hypothetical protein
MKQGEHHRDTLLEKPMRISPKGIFPVHLSIGSFLERKTKAGWLLYQITHIWISFYPDVRGTTLISLEREGDPVALGIGIESLEHFIRQGEFRSPGGTPR